MSVDEAADRLEALLQEIDKDGITIITEDMGTIFLMRRAIDRAEEFAEINDSNDDTWKKVVSR